MAHEITTRSNGHSEMAFVGETPWHGLGQSVTKGASIGVWTKEAGMDWSAKSSAVTYDAGVFPAPLEGRSVAPGYKALYRSDNRELLSIVGTNYQVVQPVEVLEFFRDLVELEGWYIHTAGTLRGGRKLWAMATHDQQGDVGKGDVVKNNLLLATSLDGSMRTTAALTSVRVVCANTLAIALGANQRLLRVSHRSQFDPTQIKQALGVAPQAFKRFMAYAKAMAETPIHVDDARAVLTTIFDTGRPKKPEINTAWLGNLAELDQPVEAEDSRSVSRVLELYQGEGKGADLKTAKGTAWGLLNAVTQYVDYEMGRTDDTRLDSAWFGRGDQFKQTAYSLLTAEVA